VAGRFEIIKNADEGLPFRFQLTADDGTVVAVSRGLDDIKSVVATITAVRENAATGFIVDMTK
jgi:uncharacterized protein YegP (UPF0339 family)